MFFHILSLFQNKHTFLYNVCLLLLCDFSNLQIKYIKYMNNIVYLSTYQYLKIWKYMFQWGPVVLKQSYLLKIYM
jgi:hypothetical protein